MNEPTENVAGLLRRIDDLEVQLKSAVAAATANDLRAQAAEAELTDAQRRLADLQPLRARVQELERLLAPATASADVLTVTYSDGRVKYAAADGNKYPIAADAKRRNQILSLMKIGLGENQAELMLRHGEEALKALTS